TSRCFGRLVVAGVLLFLDYDIAKSRYCVVTFNDLYIDKESDQETIARYMRKAFFLYGLPGSGNLSEDEKNTLEIHLSNFERDCLKKWWRNFFLHTLLYNGNFTDANRRFLKKQYGFE
ncbi:MAG: hypothetical protein AAFY36_04505, partial [Bacteroidota bacterium]